MSESPQAFFVTGFPGFIGKRLVAHLVKMAPQAKVHLLVQPKLLEDAKSYAKSLSKNIELLTGDIVDLHMGLSGEEYQRLWPEHVLAASSAVRLAPTPAASVARPRLPTEGDEVQQAVTGAWHDLVAGGHPLSDAHHHLLEQLWRGADVLLLDEPTAVLTPPEVKDLLHVLEALAAEGKTIVLVTHKLEEVAAVAARTTVMRAGRVVEEFPRGTPTATMAKALSPSVSLSWSL
jgi:hypothetical protein